jgi:hypothetical protein
MNSIEYLLDIKTLFLTWQSSNDRNKRYRVGTLAKKGDVVSFTYLTDSDDFEEALEEGFKGYPAFKISGETYTNQVLETFKKRLPPSSRRDFKKFLAQYLLPGEFHGSDFQLISHTGIQLPSDGFDLVPNLSEAEVPFDYLTEVAGTRYHLNFDDVCELPLGVEVDLVCEDDNQHDCNALAVSAGGQKIGYVNRWLCSSLRDLLNKKCVKAYVAKKSGTIERPLVYLLLKAR